MFWFNGLIKAFNYMATNNFVNLRDKYANKSNLLESALKGTQRVNMNAGSISDLLRDF